MSWLPQSCLEAADNIPCADGVQYRLSEQHLRPTRAARRWKELRAPTQKHSSIRLNDIYISDDGNEGWLVGSSSYVEHIDIRRNTEATFFVDDSHPEDNRRDLYKVCFSKNGHHGWAFGEQSLIVEISKRNDTTLMVTQSTDHLPSDLRIMDAFVSNDGTQGWAISNKGAILQLESNAKNNKWVLHRGAGEITTGEAFRFWVHQNAKRGWAVSVEGHLMKLEQDGKRASWHSHKPLLDDSIDFVKGMYFSFDGKEGRIVTLMGHVFSIVDEGKNASWHKIPDLQTRTDSPVTAFSTSFDCCTSVIANSEGNGYIVTKSLTGHYRMNRFSIYDPLSSASDVIDPSVRSIHIMPEPRSAWLFTRKGPVYFLDYSKTENSVISRKSLDSQYNESTWMIRSARTNGTVWAVSPGGVMLILAGTAGAETTEQQ